jgi:predicted transcriptional regulator
VVENDYIICIEDGAEVEGNRRAAANGRARSSGPMV